MSAVFSQESMNRFKAENQLKEVGPEMLAALEQIAAVCADNAPASCNHQLALDFVRQVAQSAIAAAAGDRPAAPASGEPS